MGGRCTRSIMLGEASHSLETARSLIPRSKYYKSAGPNLVDPTPQRTPFILQAGASKAGQSFAAAHAEAMFLPGMVPEKTRAVVETMKTQVRQLGRPESSVKFIAGIFICVDETDEKAQAKFEDLLQYADLEGTAALFGGWSGTDLATFSEDEVSRPITACLTNLH